MIWENNIETYILPYVKQMASASSTHGAGHPKPVLWDNLNRQGGTGAGKGVQDGGGYMYTHSWFILMYGKNHYNVVK